MTADLPPPDPAAVQAVARKDADVSACGTYRYTLERQWGMGPPLCFIMLNPSTADASLDDPTIRRCMGFARREGAGGIWVANLYALRSTSPALLGVHPDPVGPENDRAIGDVLLMGALGHHPVIAAWGAWQTRDGRADHIVERAADFGADLRCLGTTKDGHPRHPLYVRADQPLVPFGRQSPEPAHDR